MLDFLLLCSSSQIATSSVMVDVMVDKDNHSKTNSRGNESVITALLH